MASSDYFLRQMEGFADMLSAVFFDKKASDIVDTVYDTQTSVEGHSLLIDLRFLFMQGLLNQAENLLFERMEADKTACYAEAAREFYSWMDGLTDEKLEKSGYSRGEIDDGRADVLRFYNRAGAE